MRRGLNLTTEVDVKFMEILTLAVLVYINNILIYNMVYNNSIH